MGAPTLPVETVADAPEPDEVEEEPTDVADEAEPDEPEVDKGPSDEEIQAALDELGPDDPAVKELLARQQAQPQEVPLEEERLQFYTEQEQKERDAQTRQAYNAAQQYNPQGEAFYQQAQTRALEAAVPIAQAIQDIVTRVYNGDDSVKDFDPAQQWAADPNWIAQNILPLITEMVSQAVPAGTSYTALRVEDRALADWEQSPVHKMLTKEDREALQAVKLVQHADERVVRRNAIYRNRAIRGAPVIREKMTKEERAREREKEKHRETLARAIGGRGAATTNGTATGGSFEQLEHLYATGEASLAQQQKYFQLRQQRGL